MDKKSTDSSIGIELRAKANSLCESCGREFTCGAGEKSCWCFDIEVSPERLAILREAFKGCLCVKCLSQEPSARES